MKSILISIKPEWVAKILNGEKTIEIRKTAPKCELPIEVYIYCTKGDNLFRNRYRFFTSDEFSQIYSLGEPKQPINGKVVAKFRLYRPLKFDLEGCSWYNDELLIKSYLSNPEMISYLGGKPGYAWEILNLEIFDTPKDISEFAYIKNYKKCSKCPHNKAYYDCYLASALDCVGFLPLKRPPQNWIYVEDFMEKFEYWYRGNPVLDEEALVKLLIQDGELKADRKVTVYKFLSSDIIDFFECAFLDDESMALDYIDAYFHDSGEWLPGIDSFEVVDGYGAIINGRKNKTKSVIKKLVSLGIIEIMRNQTIYTAEKDEASYLEYYEPLCFLKSIGVFEDYEHHIENMPDEDSD